MGVHPLPDPDFGSDFIRVTSSATIGGVGPGRRRRGRGGDRPPIRGPGARGELLGERSRGRTEPPRVGPSERGRFRRTSSASALAIAAGIIPWSSREHGLRHPWPVVTLTESTWKPYVPYTRNRSESLRRLSSASAAGRVSQGEEAGGAGGHGRPRRWCSRRPSDQERFDPVAAISPPSRRAARGGEAPELPVLRSSMPCSIWART